MAAIDLGHEYLVLTDHSPRLTVAHGLSADRLREQLDVVAALNETPRRAGVTFRLLTGIEVDILADGSLDQERRAARRARRRGRVGPQWPEGRPGRDDPADAHRGRATRTWTSSATAPGASSPSAGRQGATGPTGRPGPAGEPVRRRGRLRRLRRARQGGRDQLPAGPADPPKRLLRLAVRRAAGSPSTPTRTRPGSSTGCTTAASGPPCAAYDSERVVNTWPAETARAWAQLRTAETMACRGASRPWEMATPTRTITRADRLVPGQVLVAARGRRAAVGARPAPGRSPSRRGRPGQPDHAEVEGERDAVPSAPSASTLRDRPPGTACAGAGGAPAISGARTSSSSGRRDELAAGSARPDSGRRS